MLKRFGRYPEEDVTKTGDFQRSPEPGKRFCVSFLPSNYETFYLSYSQFRLSLLEQLIRSPEPFLRWIIPALQRLQDSIHHGILTVEPERTLQHNRDAHPILPVIDLA
jgi:hypothetical protein